tara:strand:+ start:1016 stop:1396 length:381 start_codon:yes stop_codon:yes gene_type:complete
MEQPNGVGGLSNQATPSVGDIYCNKHNLRNVRIREKRITDTGLVMYWAEDLEDSRGTYLSDSDLCNNIDWVKRNAAFPTTTFREGKAPTVEYQQGIINSKFYQWVCENHMEVAQEYHEMLEVMEVE